MTPTSTKKRQPINPGSAQEWAEHQAQGAFLEWVKEQARAKQAQLDTLLRNNGSTLDQIRYVAGQVETWESFTGGNYEAFLLENAKEWANARRNSDD